MKAVAQAAKAQAFASNNNNNDDENNQTQTKPTLLELILIHADVNHQNYPKNSLAELKQLINTFTSSTNTTQPNTTEPSAEAKKERIIHHEVDADILLYYKYCSISNPGELREWQHTLCLQLGLTGRSHTTTLNLFTLPLIHIILCSIF